MTRMFPYFDTGVQVSVAMLALYGLLAAASLSVWLAAKGKTPGTLSQQVNAWWRIFPVISLALLTYPLGLTALAYLIYLLACLELESHYDGQRQHFWLVAVVIAAVTHWTAWRYPVLAMTAVLGAIAVQACRWRYWPGPRQLVWLLMLITGGAMYVLAVFPSLPFGPRLTLSWLFYLFMLTALNDIGQFIAGKLFGRHKIAPAISPNKTWQGFAGGIVVSLAVSFALGHYLSLADSRTLTFYALLLSTTGFAGDLMFSAAKRYLSIKDFSALIPGHGGILDRVDSLVLTAPLLYCLLCIAQ